MDSEYPPIAEHGLIGDLQTAALVTTNGSIEFTHLSLILAALDLDARLGS